MKGRKEGKERWEDFVARVGMKRSGAGEGKKGAGSKAVPNDILVQRMSSTASGRLKKFETLDTRDFFPFGDYDDLTIANIKEACEKCYQAPSCTKLEQIKGKKVYFIRFLPPKSTDVAPKLGQQLFEDSLAPAEVTMSVPSPIKTSGNLPALHSMVFPKSVTNQWQTRQATSNKYHSVRSGEF